MIQGRLLGISRVFQEWKPFKASSSGGTPDSMEGSLKGPEYYLHWPKLICEQKVSEHVLCDRPEGLLLLYMWDLLGRPCD